MHCNYNSDHASDSSSVRFDCSDCSNYPDTFRKIAFVGAGCYGTAIAQSFSSRVSEIIMISDSEAAKESINCEHVSRPLGNAPLSHNIRCDTAYSSIADAEVVFITVPVGAVAAVCAKIKECRISAPLVLCSKGVDVENTRLISDMVADILSNDLLVFSGPSFANEVIRGLPFGVNIAGKNLDFSKNFARKLSSDTCLIEPISDYIGLQISGAFKNILAIGCGMRRGASLGNNSITQFIVEGTNEMGNLIEAMGGMRETLLRLGGIGDIILTCTGAQSRNGRFGEFLAQGGTLKTWEGALAEGAFAAKAIPGFSEKYGVRMRTFDEVYKAIYSEE